MLVELRPLLSPQRVHRIESEILGVLFVFRHRLLDHASRNSPFVRTSEPWSNQVMSGKPCAARSVPRVSASSPFPTVLPSCSRSRNGSCPPSPPFPAPLAVPPASCPLARAPSRQRGHGPPRRPGPVPLIPPHLQYLSLDVVF